MTYIYQVKGSDVGHLVVESQHPKLQGPGKFAHFPRLAVFPELPDWLILFKSDLTNIISNPKIGHKTTSVEGKTRALLLRIRWTISNLLNWVMTLYLPLVIYLLFCCLFCYSVKAALCTARPPLVQISVQGSSQKAEVGRVNKMKGPWRYCLQTLRRQKCWQCFHL